MDSAHTRKFEDQVTRAKYLDNNSQILLKQKELTEYALELILRQRIAPIEELLLTKQIKQGILVTFHRPVYFKGVSTALEKERKGQKFYAEFHTKLSEFNDLVIKGKFSPEHFTCSSSADRLSRKATRFMLAFVEQVQTKIILLKPIIIGDRIYRNGSKDILFRTKNEQRIYPEDIDEFAKLASTDAQEWDIEQLKDISEKDIKKMFAKILNEGNIPKDWGGETSDLFTNHIHIKGVRASAAFLLKGPAKFHKLTLRKCMKSRFLSDN
jgi:hypothetical protein